MRNITFAAWGLWLAGFFCAGAAQCGDTPGQSRETRASNQHTAQAAAVCPYGVCAHIARGDEHPYAQRELSLMRRAGIGWVRTDFSWSSVERPRGQWHFEQLDQTVAWAEAAGVQILPILDYDVDWARPAHKHLDLWCEYVRRVVGRYHQRIRYWEVWNEPNLEGFWRDKPDPAAYTRLLKATAETIRAIDPGLVVLLGGTAGLPWQYIEGIYRAGGQESFDVMNVHPYRYPASPEERPLYEDLLRLRKLMAQYGDQHKPIWITEIGWPTHEGPRGSSPERQAQMLARAYLIALQAGVEVVFWYEFQAPERRSDYNEDHFGIVHRELEPKPAYAALATLARLRPPGAKPLPDAWRSGAVHHPGWQCLDGRRVWAIWDAGAGELGEHGTVVTVNVEGRITQAVDHLGQAQALEATTGRVRLKIGAGPLYLVGPQRLSLVSAP